jgi:hypothetical protein
MVNPRFHPGFRINLWHMEITDQSFNIVDIKPANMEELQEVSFFPKAIAITLSLCWQDQADWAWGSWLGSL